MKKLMFFIGICLFPLSFTADAKQPLPIQISEASFATATFKVYGSCGMCKRTIEQAANELFGVKSAKWDMDSGTMTVHYRSWAVSLDRIKQAIADVGYDTDTHRAKDSVYEGLHHCCKYERPSK